MDSILTDVKKMVGVGEEYDHFDVDIIVDTNLALAIATQMGVGPATGFSISGSEVLWTDFIPESPLLHFVKSFICLKVKLIFDPPTNSAALESLKALIAEQEWRIISQLET